MFSACPSVRPSIDTHLAKTVRSINAAARRGGSRRRLSFFSSPLLKLCVCKLDRRHGAEPPAASCRTAAIRDSRKTGKTKLDLGVLHLFSSADGWLVGCCCSLFALLVGGSPHRKAQIFNATRVILFLWVVKERLAGSAHAIRNAQQ